MNSKHNDSQGGLGPTERHLLEVMNSTGKFTIRALDLENQLDMSRAKINLILSRLCKKGWIQRLRSGVYRTISLGSESINPVPEDPWAIAAELFSPCYISGWTAAEHWNLTEQIFNSTVVFTAQKQRKKEFLIAGLKYVTKKILSKDIFGTKKIWSSNTQIQIADIHRTIIDILDEPQIGGGGRQTVDMIRAYFHQEESSLEILCQYAERLGHGAVFKRLGFLAEELGQFPTSLLKKLHANIKTGIVKLDPNGPLSGPIITKWGIRVNIPLGDIA